MEICEKYLCVEKLQNTINEFLSSKKCFYIQSPMGTGKSNIIKDILKKNNKVLIITNRVSLANEFNTRYKDLNVGFYKDRIDSNSLIIQYDSLYKINLNDYDIFILDEILSILMHSLSLLTQYALFNLTKLSLILETKKIVVMDAFISKINFCNKIQIINTYRDETEVYFYKDRNYFIKSLLSSNSKKSISCSSLLSAKALFQILKKDFKVFLFSSETPDGCKEQILKDIKNDSKYDIFIFTPSITTGIDILGNFTEHYHLDDSGSCDIISSLQMIKRNRNALKIHCYVKNTIKFNISDEVILNEKIENEIKRNKIKNPFLVQLNYSSGLYELSQVGKFFNKIQALKNSLENTRVKTFIELLLYQFSNIKIINTKCNKNLLENSFKDILNKNKELISKSLEIEINDLTINTHNKVFQNSIKLQNYIKDTFGIQLPKNEMKYYLNNMKDFEHSRNRELFKKSINELQNYKSLCINSFNFNTQDIDLMIEYKLKKFKLQNLFYNKDLSKKDLRFLSLLGYKKKSNKMLLI